MTTLDTLPEDRRPPSRRMADALREAINAGTYAPGAQLPSERELARTYCTARNTAREAVSILQAEGLVEARQGKGAFVRRQTPLLRLATDRYSRRLREETGLSPFRAETTRQGRTARVDCTSIERVAPPRDVAERLGVSPHTKSVVRRENVYYADDEPVQLVTTYLPWSIVKGSVVAKQARTRPGGIYEALEELGHIMRRYSEEIGARMPRPSEAHLLGPPPGVPVIEVTHVSYDQNDQPYDVTYFVMRADRMGLAYDVPVTD